MNQHISWLARDGEKCSICHKDIDLAQRGTSFLETLRLRGLSPHTICAYGFDLVCFFRWLWSIDRAVSEFTYQDLFEYLKHQVDRKAKPRSVNRRLVVSRLFLQFLVDRDFPVHSSHLRATARVAHTRQRGSKWGTKRGLTSLKVKVPRDVVEPLTTKEVNLILSKSKRHRDIAILLIMALVGLRRSEVLAAEIGDVDFQNRTLRIRGKGSKERIMPIPPLISQALSKYIHYERPGSTLSERIFLVLQGHRRGLPMTIGGIRSLLRSRRLSTSVHHANPHRFRHTFASSMVRSGVSILVLQKMLGHARYETTLRYVALNSEDVAREYFKAIETLEKHHVKKESKETT